MPKTATYQQYTVAEIHLDHLVHNLKQIREKVAPAEIMAVVKADAYGHGVIPVTKRLIREGIRQFTVARVSEAAELRDAGINQTILVLGSLFPDEIDQALRLNTELSITNEKDVDTINQIAGKLGKTVNVHLYIDTGMGLVGIFPEQAVSVIRKILNSPSLKLVGLYSHFATADEADKSYAEHQLELFNSTLSDIQKAGIKLPCVHMANTSGIIDLPEAYFDMVRAGISLYGYYPSTTIHNHFHLKAVMTLKSRVGLLRRFTKGMSISYGRRFVTPKETTVAIIQIGYADGIQRAFTNNADVMISGRLYPVVGTIAMDQIAVDVGDDSVQVGDEVLFWGNSSQGNINLTEIAERIGTIPYELTCGVTKRVPRVYLG